MLLCVLSSNVLIERCICIESLEGKRVTCVVRLFSSMVVILYRVCIFSISLNVLNGSRLCDGVMGDGDGGMGENSLAAEFGTALISVPNAAGLLLDMLLI